MINWFYSFFGLNDSLNCSVGIVIHVINTNRTPVTSACWKRSVVVEEVGFPFVVDNSRVRGKAVRYVFLNNSLVFPWTFKTFGGAVFDHFRFGSGTCIYQVINSIPFVNPGAFDKIFNFQKKFIGPSNSIIFSFSFTYLQLRFPQYK